MAGTDRIIAELQDELKVLEPQLEEVRTTLATLESEVRRIQRAVKVLKGEPLGNPQGRRGPRGSYDKTGSNAAYTEESTGKRRTIGEGKVNAIQAIIMQMVQEESDEFRQVDVRARAKDLTSSSTALAFEVLRQRGVIRFARQEGLNKWYRLTRAVANKNGNGDDEEMTDAAGS